jgi:hypothetical protein
MKVKRVTRVTGVRVVNGVMRITGIKGDMGVTEVRVMG